MVSCTIFHAIFTELTDRPQPGKAEQDIDSKEVEMIVIESINHIGITVSDLNASINFYKDLFDFEVADKSTEGQAYLKMGDIILSLYEVKDYKNQDNVKNRVSFYVDEEDFDDALDELEESGIEIIYGPENIRNGRSVVFLDPDRNQIEISYPKVL